MNDAFDFSNRHKDLMARDEEYVLGWRFEPRIIFERGAPAFSSSILMGIPTMT